MLSDLIRFAGGFTEKAYKKQLSIVRYYLDINSTELMEKLCREASVFVGAGDSFGMDQHLRVAFGQDEAVLNEALGRIRNTLEALRS